MRVIDPGHTFELDHLDGSFKTIIEFAKRTGAQYPFNNFSHQGTTSQEVLRALIARTKYVDMQRHWGENQFAIWLMRMVIWLFEFRAARARGKIKWFSLRNIEFKRTCQACLHIECEKHKGEQ